MANPISELRKEGRLDNAITLGRDIISSQNASANVYIELFNCCYDKILNLCKYDFNHKSIPGIVIEMEALIPYLPDSLSAESYLDKLKSILFKEYQIIGEALRLCKSNNPQNVAKAYKMTQPLFSNSSKALKHDIGKILLRHISVNYSIIGPLEVSRLLDKYLKLDNPRPSDLHSEFLETAVSHVKNYPDFPILKYFLKWNPKYLRQQDYKSKGSNKNSDDNSLASRLVEAICRENESLTPNNLQQYFCSKNITLTKIANILRKFTFERFQEIKNPNDSDKTTFLRNYINTLADFGPGEYHSKVLLLAMTVFTGKKRSKFIPFFLKWGTDNFLKSDWSSPREDKPAFAISVLGLIHKLVLRNPSLYKKTIPQILPLFKKGCTLHPQNHKLQYKYASMLLRSGNKDSAKVIFSSLIQYFPNDYTLWHSLSLTESDVKIRIALIQKAISLQPNESQLGEIRIELANLLLHIGKPAYAAVELNKYYAARYNRNSPLSKKYLRLKKILNNHPLNTSEYTIFYYKCLRIAKQLINDDSLWNDYAVVKIRNTKKNYVYNLLLADADSNIITCNNLQFPNGVEVREGMIIEMRNNDTILGISANSSSVKISNKEDWSILPQNTGYVSFINDKNIALANSVGLQKTVLIQDAPEWIKPGMFISFSHLIFKNQKKLTEIHFGKNPQPADFESNAKNFDTTIAAIDKDLPDLEAFHFVTSDDKQGLIKYNTNLPKIKIGDCVDIRYFSRINKDNKEILEVIDCKINYHQPPNLIRTVSGEVTLIRQKGISTPQYGFVNDCFIPTHLASKMNGCDYANGRAAYCGNGKWIVFEIFQD